MVHQCPRNEVHVGFRTLLCSSTIFLWGLQFTKLQFLEKLSALVNFVYSSSTALVFGIIHQNFQKNSPKIEVSKIFKMQPTPSKALGDTPSKREGIKVILFCLLRQSISFELRMI